MVLIGVDPHKGSHTAVVVDRDENEVARLTVRADRNQLQRLMTFAAPLKASWASKKFYIAFRARRLRCRKRLTASAEAETIHY